MVSAVKPTKSQLDRAKREGWDWWIQSPQDEIAVARGCYFDRKQALQAVNFFRYRLTHGKDRFEGQPFELIDWQIERLVAPLYGWKTAEGRRRYRRVFVFIPKKNGKTQIAAGIAMLELHYCRGSRVYLTATSQGQATECFDEAAGMVDRSPHLRGYLNVRRSTGRIIYPRRNGLIQTLGTKANTSEGKNASALIIDELHAWKDREFFASLYYAGAMRLDPLTFIITTAGDDMDSICGEEYDAAKRVLSGDDPAIDYLPLIFEGDDKLAWDDLENWKIANPNIGTIIPIDNVKADIENARGKPKIIADLKRYRLNLWVKGNATWLSKAKWKQAGQVTPDVKANGRLYYAGLDMARTRDFAAAALIAGNEDDGFDLRIRLYTPFAGVRDKEASDRIPLTHWIETGQVIATPGDTVDDSYILRDLEAWHNELGICELGYDSYNASLFVKNVRDRIGLECVAVPQTMPYLGPPSGVFERALTAGKIRHEGNKALEWMIGNAVALTDPNDNVRPNKRRSRGRIDGLAASLTGLQRLMNPKEKVVLSDAPAFFV